MRKNIFTIAIIVIIFVLTSCEKENESLNTVNNFKNELGLNVKDGYLIFKDNNSFIKTVSTISDMNRRDREKWEKTIGFVSQSRLIAYLIDQESALDSLNRIKFANGDFSNATKYDFRPELFYNLLSKQIIKLVDQGSPEEYWDCSVYDRSSTTYINEDGIYVIADSIFQVTNQGIKSTLYSKYKSKEELISELSMRGSARRIPKSYLKTSDLVRGEQWADWTTTGKWPSVQRRIKIGTELSFIEFLVPTQRITFSHKYYVKCQKTNLFNSWIYDNVNVIGSGSWEIGVYKYPQIYANSHTFNLTCSDLVGSINPETAELVPFSNFQVLPNAENANVYWEINYNDFLPYYNSFNWTVTRTDVNISSTKSYNP